MPSVSEEPKDSSDLIALRAAISILQLQRERSKADLVALERVKRQAVADPDSFVEELTAGRLRKTQATSDIAPSAEPTTTRRSHRRQREQQPSDVDVTDEEDNLSSQGDEPSSKTSKFDPIPLPQNVVRCPPINWAKYHVVGESLDKLHAERTRRPGTGEMLQDGARAPVGVLAAPYSPFIDKVTESATSTEADKGS